MANEQVEQGQAKLVDSVLKRVNELTSKGGFRIPDGYVVENALRVAYFIIGETLDKDRNPALQVCTPDSVAEALFRMVMAGADPGKKQCYFIVNAKKLTFRVSYFGNVAIAKRVADVAKVRAKTVHQGDEFSYEIEDGDITAVFHKQSPENLDKPIVYAYAIATFEDGQKYIDVMTMAEIKESWKMSINQNNNKLQNNFSIEAAKRTVKTRCLKPIINESNDSNLFQKDAIEENEVEETTHEVVNENKTRKVVSLPPATVKQTIPMPEKKAEPEMSQNTMFDTVDEEEQELPPLERD